MSKLTENFNNAVTNGKILFSYAPFCISSLALSGIACLAAGSTAGAVIPLAVLLSASILGDAALNAEVTGEIRDDLRAKKKAASLRPTHNAVRP